MVEWGNELVGHETAKRALDLAGRKVRDQAAAILISGEHPGIGKTELLLSFLAHQRNAGWLVARAVCTPTGRPAWVQVTNGLRRAQGQSSASPEPPIEPSPDRGEAWLDILALASSRAPVLVVIEDLENADEESIQHIHRAVTELCNSPILVALSESGPEAAESNIADHLVVLRRYLSASEVLRPLSQDQTVELVERKSGTRLDRDAASWAWSFTGGIPVWIVLLAQVLRESNHPELELKRYRPRERTDCVLRLIRLLSREERAVLEAAAILDKEYFYVSDVLPYVDFEEDEASDLLDHAERLGLVTRSNREPLNFWMHGVKRLIIQSQVSPERRRELTRAMDTGDKELVPQGLGRRHLPILQALAERKSNGDIVRTTRLTMPTVKSYVHDVYVAASGAGILDAASDMTTKRRLVEDWARSLRPQ